MDDNRKRDFYNGVHPHNQTKEERRLSIKVLRTSPRYAFFEFEREDIGFAKVRRRFVETVFLLFVADDFESPGKEACEDCRAAMRDLMSCLKYTTECFVEGPDDFCIVHSHTEQGAVLQRAAQLTTAFAKRYCC